MKVTILLLVSFMFIAAFGLKNKQNIVKNEFILSTDKDIITNDNLAKKLSEKLDESFGFKVLNTFTFGHHRYFHLRGEEQYVSRIAQLPGVKYVEKNTYATLLQTCDPQPSPGTWGLDRLDQREALPYTDPTNPDATYAPGEHTGSDVIAYVIDTGIEWEHPDFNGHASWGYSAPGMNDEDGHSHGTHCAGTIGSMSYGVAKDVQMVAVKVLNRYGIGTVADFLGGMEWILEDHLSRQSDLGVMPKSVISASLLYGPEQSIDDAVQECIDAGIVMVAGAGNDDADACSGSPARAPNAITVGATNVTDTSAFFSNYGSCVDIYAPGVDILSTVLNGQTAVYSGTSMATPHVAGAVAKYQSSLEVAPTPAEVDEWLAATATPDAITWYNDRHALSENVLLYSGC